MPRISYQDFNGMPYCAATIVTPGNPADYEPQPNPPFVPPIPDGYPPGTTSALPWGPGRTLIYAYQLPALAKPTQASQPQQATPQVMMERPVGQGIKKY
jgi:uncharacterized membrane protein